MKKMVRAAIIGSALAAALPATGAQAATVVLNLTGIQTFDAFQDSSNIIRLLNIGAGSRVTGLTYNVTISTIGGSYLSEASIYYTDSAITDGVVFRPGIADARTGTATYTGTSDLIASGLDFVVGADGILRVEFAESFDDLPNAADANLSGSLTFDYTPAATSGVPEPASWALMVSGFGVIGGALRRRPRTSTTTVTYA